jgi:3'-phosphoadenosine 5'-phosphosulfate (PAPS) 3'-phosphatase
LESGNSNIEREAQYGAVDVIGATLKLRTFNYVPGKAERFLVYTSEKNWFLEAHPVGIEDVSVPAGTFKAMKVRLQTFIGKEMQQKGDVFVWIADDKQRTASGLIWLVDPIDGTRDFVGVCILVLLGLWAATGPLRWGGE